MSITDQKKVRLLIVIFSGCVGLLLIGYFHWMIGRGIINGYEVQKLNKRKEISGLRQQLIQINATLAQKSEIAKQAETIQKITRRLPSSPDAPGFLNSLITILGTTGIIQEEVKPTVAANRSLYTEIPYTIKAHGHYHAFGQFLTLIEQNSDRFMRIKSLRISNNIKRPSIHPVELEIATFMFNQK